MADFNTTLWAPWRMEYIRSLVDETREDGCFFCNYWSDPGGDRKNHVVWRGHRGFVMMNRFPYTCGHLMVAAGAHQGDPLQLDPADVSEITTLTWRAVALLRKALRPEGFNVGSNLGHCAGAGVPDHYHVHVVPRWMGDTNYMSIVGDVRVVPESLDALHTELVANAVTMGLRDKPESAPTEP